MSEKPVLLTIDDAIATITLNRPDKLNAINNPMLTELEALIADLEQNQSVRVVILTGAGERAFCAGADIKAWSTLEPLDMWRQWIRAGHRVFNRLARLRQPVIAALNGYTFGGGLELALAADLRLAAERASLALPEATVGTIPAWTGSQRLPRIIGPARAKQMIFTAARIDPVTAERWGLVNEVVADESLLDRAHESAAEIAAQAPLSVQVAKQLIDGSQGEGLDTVLESLASGMLSQTEDGHEGGVAFRERRPPEFKGR